MVAIDGSRYRCSSWNERRWATSVVIAMVVVECTAMMKVKATTRIARIGGNHEKSFFLFWATGTLARPTK